MSKAHEQTKAGGNAIESTDSINSLFDLQVLVVTDPYLMIQLLHNKALLKPPQPDYIQFRQVST